VLKKLPAESVHLVATDPPYRLSREGGTTSRGKSDGEVERVSVVKGAWDRPLPPGEALAFEEAWLAEVYRVLVPGGSLWTCGSMHNLFAVGYALQRGAWDIRNLVTWEKSNPPPNLGRRCLTHGAEHLIWATKPGARYFFDYDFARASNGGVQMRDVWRLSASARSEKLLGKHPTQKPVALFSRIIQLCSRPDDLVCDPFFGSCSTGVAAVRLGRRFLGVERDPEHFALGQRRIAAEIAGDESADDAATDEDDAA
jgi:site-specific DNA-methyltransferase (adenine-specific)